jgi:hypothetical protein
MTIEPEVAAAFQSSAQDEDDHRARSGGGFPKQQTRQHAEQPAKCEDAASEQSRMTLCPS